MKKYLLFDLDGTLTDPEVGITTCVQYALRSFGIEEPDLSRLTPFIGPPLRESFMKFYDLSAQQAEQAVAKYRERFQDTGIFENEVYEGIPEMLKTLQAEGLTLAVASSKPQVYVDRILDHFDLKKYFKVVVGSELDGKRENKDEVVQEALNRLFACDHTKKDQVYMIGDRCFDVAGARALGVESVAVTYGFGNMRELKAAKADYIVRSVDELQRFLLREVNEEKDLRRREKGLNFVNLWVMLRPFLIFMTVRTIVICVADPLVTQKTGLGFAAGALVIWKEAQKWIRKAAEDSRLNYLRRDGRSVYVLLAVAVAGSTVGLNLLFELLGLTGSSDTYQAVRSAQFAVNFLPGLITYGLVSPIAEELMFRGIIHNYLKNFFPVRFALLISSALFGIYHMNYVQGIYGFLMGCLIAYGYEYFGKFRVAFLVHAGANILVYCLTNTTAGAEGFVSWPMCLIFLAMAAGALGLMRRQKRAL